MKLPGGEAAIVDAAKITDYLLNPFHPVGGAKAKLFKALLGIDRANCEILKDALLAAARDGEAILGKQSPHGAKFELRFQMTGPRGTYTILSVWIIETGHLEPRLVTAYIE
ncbi:MAG TPA: hypothetical protein VFE47_27975 [Tepidisphaeraceae bacterium]|jgi:hypothetical protein|nr:hypothetical protein [Tepidisphaeraceae bacterium]